MGQYKCTFFFSFSRKWLWIGRGTSRGLLRRKWYLWWCKLRHYGRERLRYATTYASLKQIRVLISVHYHNQLKKNPYFEINAWRKNIQFLLSIKHTSWTYSLVSKGCDSTFSSTANEEEAEGVYQEDSPIEDIATEDDTYDTLEQNDLRTWSTFLKELM